MSTNHTTNYNLNQWEAADKVLRTEFNEDNAKIDAALKSNADAIGTLEGQMASVQAGKGNCQVVYGTYQGNDEFGEAHPNTLTFDHKPILVLIQEPDSDDDRDTKLRLMRGVSWAVGTDNNYAWEIDVVWSETGVQWHSPQGPYQQFNLADTAYPYMAILAIE